MRKQKQALFYTWLIAITFASLMPASSLPDHVPLPLGTDKAVHIVMYTILTLLARVAFMRAGHGNPYRRSLAIAATIISYGILIEILQPLISTRRFEWADILANTAGVLCGCLLWRREPPNRHAGTK